MAERNYWLFGCDPAEWEIDLAMRDGIVDDHWRIVPEVAGKIRAGDLALVRVNRDQRTQAVLGDRRKLELAIYGICSVEGGPQPGTGSHPVYRRGSITERAEDGTLRQQVPIRWLHTFADCPLKLSAPGFAEMLREPNLVLHLRKSVGRMNEADFNAIVARLGVALEPIARDINPATHVDDRLLDAALEDHVYEVMVRRIEDSGVGDAVKKANGYKCQVCAALGISGHTFLTTDGTPYVEAHHAVPRHLMVRGSLHRTNVIAVCAGHHRQLHHGNAAFVKRLPSGMLHLTIDGSDLFLKSN